MSDINTILSKFFDGEASPQEEKLVKEFQIENPEEFELLKKLWSKQELPLADFDVEKGLEAVISKVGKPQQKSQYITLRKVAAAAAILLLACALFLFNSTSNSPQFAEVMTGNKKEKVELSDGSIVYLNTNSSLTYTTHFESNVRRVTLHGEAFFEITKDVNRPFIVHTNHADVEVLGTSFNIDTRTQKTAIVVKTGKVKVESQTNDQSSILLPNQSASVTATEFETFDVVGDNYLAWNTGVFYFEQATLAEVVQELNTYYGDHIKLMDASSPCLFTSTLQDLELNEVIDILTLSCDLNYREINGTYELYE